MKNMKLKSKILLPVALLITVLVAVVLLIAMLQMRSLSDYLVNERIESAAHGVRYYLSDVSRQVIQVGIDIANDPRMGPAVATGNFNEILRVSNQLVAEFGITYITVIDTKGIGLARTDEPARYGDPMTNRALLNALDGAISVAYTASGIRRIPVRASVPVYHNGEIIGAMVAGFALDTPKAAQQLAERYNAAVTIFVDDERVASTMYDERGVSVVGTRMENPEILRTVFQERREFMEEVVLFGRSYSTFYMPLIDPYGNDLGTVLLALPLDDINAEITATTLIAIAVGIVGLIIALVILFFIIGNIISPIKGLVGLVKDVSGGRLNVNVDRAKISRDEIGELSLDVLNLVDVIKNIVDDLDETYKQYIEVGNIKFQMDADKYNNSFQDVIVSINKLIYQTADDILVMADELNKISHGDFNIKLDEAVWVGDWSILPQTLNNLSSNLTAVSGEINAMIEAAAVKGDLSFTIDASRYEGDWGKIMNGLNQIAKEVNAPFKVLGITLEEMKAGNFDLKDIDSKILAAGIDPNPSSYNGSFKQAILASEDCVNSTSSYINEIESILSKISGGDLCSTINREYVGSFDLIKISINDISTSLHKTMSEISSASEQVLAGAKQISSSSMDLANGAQTQASSLQELNASIDMINQQTGKNAENASNANSLSHKSTTNAQEGNESMKQMLSAMEQIKDASNNISKIIRSIQDIAFQTNLLALNAAVEAARAGEHGKGFAVVAEEVRSLAARSQSAATETTNLIQESINRVESGSEIAVGTSASLGTIVEGASEISRIIEQISNASNEQAEAISQVSVGLQQISQVVQSNSAVSEETAAASEELNSQAELLQQLVAYFKL
ncbi:MAG: methyl-accepting chemotaxis protein [Defluviitaleaceae bacterium]|nr:methyl-accepting chemotaxis protein [Defluviitaleaceae bacterium]